MQLRELSQIPRLAIGLLLCIVATSEAQVVRGRVADEAGQGIGFATVAVLGTDSALVSGVQADDQGQYQLSLTQAGEYIFKSGSVGFRYVYKPITVRDGAAITVNFTLQPQGRELQAVEVRAQRALVTQEAGRTVVNVEASIAAAGSTAMDVLRRAPGVLVDNDGNVSLKGKPDVTIYLDGKAVQMSPAQLAALLKALPASQLKEIELITNPGANYDAQGNAGIINLKLKQGVGFGTQGSLQATGGTGRYYKGQLGTSISHKRGPWSLSGGYDWLPNKGYSDYRQWRLQTANASPGSVLPDTSSVLETRQLSVNPAQSHSFRAQANYQISANTTLEAQGNGQLTDAFNISNNTVRDYRRGTLFQNVNTYERNPQVTRNISGRLSARHVGSAKDSATQGGPSELAAYVDAANYYTYNAQNARYTYSKPAGETDSINRLSSKLPLHTRVFIAAADYAKGLSKDLRIEAGAKLTVIRTQADARISTSRGQDNDLYRPERSSVFRYQESIPAVYLQAGYKHGDWQAKAGLRTEGWQATGIQQLTDTRFKRDSLFLFPSAQVSYRLSSAQSLSASYGRRIDRPSYGDLNPITYYSDPYSLFSGNPSLLPQITDNLELTHTYLDGLIGTTINYANTQNFIAQYVPSFVDSANKIQTLSSQNFARRINYGLAVNLSLPWLGGKAQTQVFVNLYRNRFKGNYAGSSLDVARTSIQANLNQQLSLPKDYSAEVSAFYQGPSVGDVSTGRSFGYLTLGVQKKILKGRGSIKLTGQDILHTFVFRFASDYGPFKSNGFYGFDNRQVLLTFSYQFGNLVGKRQAQAQDQDDRVGGGRR